jgi:hypothetical protein
MSMSWKAGRVAQLFGVWLQKSFTTELLRFCFFLTAVCFIQISTLRFDCDQLGASYCFSWLCFQMDMSKYHHFTIAEDGRLGSTGQHRPGFPRVLYDTLLHVGYNRDVPIYHARVSMAHCMEQHEVSVTIPIRPEEPWSVTVLGVELDDTIDKTTHFALACSRLADTAATPLTLFLFCYQGDPV